MKDNRDKELKRETIIAKFIKKLKMIEKDPDVIDYNFYSDKSFVGVKIMRNKKITLDELAAIVIEGFAEQKKFNAEQRIINEEQKKYNKKIDKIEADIAELKHDVVEIKQDIVEIRKDLNEVRELPIIKEALKNSKNK